MPNGYEYIYIVQQGDTLYSIAKRFDTTIEQIMRLNHLDNPLIMVGQRLLIPDRALYYGSTSIV
ncbi:stage VI sporulation protein D [Anaerosolibacter carboniphilus]|uniref:Stage VI sporulation protein D n=1 Tax=Anaerosolibacter carboniphilus TaxID=1417629 RepID=A0A841L299_9FIRM|nr:LysM peptidoglycan-binding domain-containing protein [Anaerosolibacter carboniphilus]MBB6218300.1 stage VI sporulation protein D [Anaerosolibacter carboniphilus]